jgi:hypothetical protein
LLKFLQKLAQNEQKLHTSVFVKFGPQTQNMNFSRSRESWLTSSRNFEVLMVKLKQTLFFHLILKNILRKIEKTQKLRIFFCSYLGCFVLLKTLTIDLGHCNDIITAENVGTKISGRTRSKNMLSYFFCQFLPKLSITRSTQTCCSVSTVFFICFFNLINYLF